MCVCVLCQGVLSKVRVEWETGEQYPLALELLLQLTTAEDAVPSALHVRRAVCVCVCVAVGVKM